MVTSGSKPEPILISLAASTIPASTSSYTGRSTKIRLPAEHTSPWLPKMPQALPGMASARSASAKTMLGLFPPSSRVTRFSESAQVRMMCWPIALEPVKLILSTSGCSSRGWPASGPRPVSTLSTPAGTPASSAARARPRAVRGVCSAGFSTTVQPAARAGATFWLAISRG